MLSTLMRYDFKRLFKWVLPFCAGTILAAGLFVFVFWRMMDPEPPVFETYLMLPYAFTAMISMLALVGGFVGVLIMVCRNYYKNLMTDEGYLTFTLPVNHNQILASKVISGSVCTLLGMLATIVGFFIIIFGITSLAADGVQAGAEYTEEIGIIGGADVDMSGTIFVLLSAILTGIIQLIRSVIQAYFAFTVGSIIAKTHKIWAAIGIDFLADMVISTVFSFVTVPYSFLTVGIVDFEVNYLSMTGGYMLIMGVGEAAVCVVLYLWTLKLLKTKLNLT